MSDSLPPHLDPRAERLAIWSAVGGVVIALSVAAASGNLLFDQRAAGATTLGALGVTVALVAPFVASLAVHFVPSTALRRAVWLSNGVLGLILGGLTLLSGVGFLFIAAAVGLLAAWWLSRGLTSAFGPARAIAVSAWLLLSFGAALAGLWLRETPMCWNDSPNGAGWVVSNTANECRSDIVDDTDGLLALAGVAIGFVGLTVLTRGERDSPRTASGPTSRFSAPPNQAPSVS